MEIHKNLLDAALATGRHFQSAETGFIHLFNGKQENGLFQAVPFYENCLWVLTLFRLKTVESVTEGKRLLDKMLYYQNASGLFPVYLHDFPYSNDRLIGVHLLPPLYWVLHYFGGVLGNEMKARLEQAIQALLKATWKELEAIDPPPIMQIKSATSAIAYGRLRRDQNWIEKGELLLKKMQKELDNNSLLKPAVLGELLQALYMIYPTLRNTDWEFVLKTGYLFWHPELSIYAGPFLDMSFSKGIPNPTLFDLISSIYAGKPLSRISESNPVYLKGSLLFNDQDHPQEKVYPLQEETESYRLIQYHDGALSCMPKKGKLPQAQEKNFYPLSFSFGQQNDLKSFVLHGSKLNKADFRAIPNGVEIEIELGELPNLEDREECKEVAFFLNISPEDSCTVNGQTATTFSLNDQVVLHTKYKDLKLTFSILEGEGMFQGHWMRGVRPTELSKSAQDRFTAYDWQLFLRTIHRSEKAKLKIAFQSD